MKPNDSLLPELARIHSETCAFPRSGPDMRQSEMTVSNEFVRGTGLPAQTVLDAMSACFQADFWDYCSR
jgi:hypothetical protein